jgi:hypothetical protein
MIISTNPELRLHVPSNAVDEVMLLQGILDNSEKDFLKDKLGAALYDKLGEYYQDISPDAFVSDVMNGTYTADPWAELLLCAQRMVANDSLARYIYQQAISVNSAGVNVATSNDYDSADSKLLDKGASAFRKEAMVALNNLLVMLEGWAEDISSTNDTNDTDLPDDDGSTTDTDSKTEIVTLWKQSKYYYLHGTLLIPTCADLQHYIDIYDNRDKFIRLLPDLHFIQDEYVTDFVGEELLEELKASDDALDKKIMRKLTRMLVARLEERTTVLAIDKQRRSQAHDEAIDLQTSVASLLAERKANKEAEEAEKEGTTDITDGNDKHCDRRSDGRPGYENNRADSKMFVSPLIF